MKAYSPPAFEPPKDWVTNTLILALRYNENRGVFYYRGQFFEEIVKPQRKYVWTSAAEIERRKQAGIPLPNSSD